MNKTLKVLRVIVLAILILLLIAVVAVNLFAERAVKVGIETAALSSKILLAIANGVAEQGVGVLPKEIVDTITSTLGKTIDLSTGIIESRDDIGKKIIKGAEGIGKGVTEGLKGLLVLCPRNKVY